MSEDKVSNVDEVRKEILNIVDAAAELHNSELYAIVDALTELYVAKDKKIVIEYVGE